MDLDLIDTATGICAKRKAGKSILTSYLLEHYNHLFKRIVIISGTENVNHFYGNLDFIDNRFIRDEWDESYINALMKSMEKVNDGLTKKDPRMKHILLILDDICSSFDTHSSKAFKLLFTKGRHYGISVIVIQQYVNQIPPTVRNNCDYVMVSQGNSESLELLSNTYRFGNMSKEDFKKLYLDSTNNYGFLIINTNCASSNDELNEIYGLLRVPQEFINK